VYEALSYSVGRRPLGWLCVSVSSIRVPASASDAQNTSVELLTVLVVAKHHLQQMQQETLDYRLGRLVG
jgi:hypothetical protein